MFIQAFLTFTDFPLSQTPLFHTLLQYHPQACSALSTVLFVHLVSGWKGLELIMFQLSPTSKLLMDKITLPNLTALHQYPFPEPCLPGHGDFEYLLGWICACPGAGSGCLLCAGIRASLGQTPEEFVHPGPLSVEQRGLFLTGLTRRQAVRGTEVLQLQLLCGCSSVSSDGSGKRVLEEETLHVLQGVFPCFLLRLDLQEGPWGQL